MSDREKLSDTLLEPLHSEGATTQGTPDPLSDRIARALRGVQHGQVTIVVYDGRVVQIDRVVRIRQFRDKL